MNQKKKKKKVKIITADFRNLVLKMQKEFENKSKIIHE